MKKGGAQLGFQRDQFYQQPKILMGNKNLLHGKPPNSSYQGHSQHLCEHIWIQRTKIDYVGITILQWTCSINISNRYS